MTRMKFSALAILWVVSILFWWYPLLATLELALTNDAYTHILLIFPLSAALIYMDWKYLNTAPVSSAQAIDPQTSRVMGTALLVFALLLGGFARWGMRASPLATSEDVRLSLAMVALVAWWIASVSLCFGARTVRSFLFPLCFLFLVVPIPQVPLNWIVEFLQRQSAFAAQLIFRMARVPVTQDGIMLSIPGLEIEVARECSSIRSSLILVVTTLFFAHLFLRSWWRKTLLVLAAIPLSVAKNGLRIFTITELGTRVDPAFLNGKLHHNGGVIFLCLSVVLMSALLWMLRRTERPETEKTLPAVVKI